jgi:hypothetical protein
VIEQVPRSPPWPASEPSGGGGRASPQHREGGSCCFVPILLSLHVFKRNTYNPPAPLTISNSLCATVHETHATPDTQFKHVPIGYMRCASPKMPQVVRVLFSDFPFGSAAFFCV